MISIREFRNTDLPDFVRLWNEHPAAGGNANSVSAAALEVVILGRPYFSTRQLLIAVNDQRTLGFLHWLPVPDKHDIAVVASMAVSPCSEQDEAASLLLKTAQESAALLGARRLLMGQSPDHWTGYAGMGRHAMGGGVPDDDADLQRWALQGGFYAEQQLQTHVVRAHDFRPAMDRELIAIRRTATVERRRDVTDQPFRIASAMSHLELHRFVARQRSGTVMAEADILIGDPEMMVVNSGMAILSRWQSFGVATEQSRAVIRYVLSTALSELIAERTNQITATVFAADALQIHLLQSAGFVLDYRGTVFGKTMH